MNTKNIITIIVVIAAFALVGVLFFTTFFTNTTQAPDDQSSQVNNVVVNFGTKLNNVSLLASDAATQIQQQYSPYVTQELLDQWKQDVLKAPGRRTSSPWPDRIEITSTQKSSDGTYTVTGDIIEVTSQEAGTQNAANKIPVTLIVEKRSDKWLISSFTQQLVLRASKDDLIFVTSPLPNQKITSPLAVTGQARGNWYFEASFPVKLLDANGKMLAQVPAQAQGEWMTTDYVPFNVTLTFAKPATATGTLVLEKDNPSGLPEHANELRIPVTFEAAKKTVTLYYYDASKDKDAFGNALCSEKGLVAVQRQIPVSQTPIQDTIKLLLQGQLSSIEVALGISTEYPLAGVTLESADLKNGILTLQFKDPQNKTSGGSCRATLLWKQIEATAKQFSEVREVKFTPESLFQP